MRKIKIAEVITRLDWGGSPDILRIMCIYLDSKVYDIRLVIGQTRYPSLKTKDFLRKFRDRLTVISQLKRNISPINDLLALIRLYCLFHKQRFDIVHTHTAKAGALARIAAYFAGVPAIIHTPHGHNFYGYFNAFVSRLIVLIERVLAYITDRIMVLTELEKKDYLRYNVANEKKLILIYQGLELEEFKIVDSERAKLRENFGVGTEEKLVGFVGRLEQIKGLRYFIEAARIVLEKRKDTKFILLGEGGLRSSLETQIHSWGIEDKIIFAGWREDISEIFCILDILVLPSLNEAVGIVLLEAQAQGVPVVASSVGGIPEIVRDKQTGILVSPRDVRGLTEAILTLLDNPDKAFALGLAAQVWVRDRYKAEKMVKEVSGMYAEILKDKHVIA